MEAKLTAGLNSTTNEPEKIYRSKHYVTKRAFRSFMPRFVLITFFLVFLGVRALTLLAHSEEQALTTRAESTVEIVRNMVQRDFQMILADIAFFKNFVEHSQFLLTYSPQVKNNLEHIFIEKLTTHTEYDQLRLLSGEGLELIRANQNSGSPVIVPESLLQDKSDRYYYQEAVNVQPGQVYVSKLDLNIENGKVETPLKPMLRIAMPIWNKNNRIDALVILNYSAQPILESIQNHLQRVVGNGMVLDHSGFWILKDQENVEWSFLLGENESLASETPELWQHISLIDNNHFDFLGSHYLAESIPLESGKNFSDRVTPHNKTDWKIAISYEIPKVSVAYFLSMPVLVFLVSVTYPLITMLIWFLCVQEAKRKYAEIKLSKFNQNLELEVDRRTKEIQVTKDATIECLASLAETRDNETGAHIRRTQEYIKILLDELRENSPYKSQATETACQLIVKSAPLHDIGKIGIPDEILLKPGKLTGEEFEIMKTHTTLGSNALDSAIQSLSNSDTELFLVYTQQIACSHHEKWDGSGYPQGLKGEEIPLSARLMAIADVYDALVSKRVYKTAFSRKQAEDIILNQNKGHFDPIILAAFETLRDEFWEIREKHQE